MFRQLSTLFLALSLPLAPLQAVAKLKKIDDQSELKILNPALAERKTAKIVLPNGLEALLISDPGSDLSAAALAVEAGSWQDPIERPGLAHYTEHMLFLGSKTYPSETGFRSYVDDRGGTFNAYTADRVTNYAFAVTNPDFAEAIDRFSHFFIDPAFTASALGREVKAVNQEFERTLENDDWRTEMVRKNLSQAGHPDSRFNIGDRNTLGGTSSEEVRRWYEGHYSSNLMHLAILSPLPLAQLEKLVVEKFGRVPNRNLKRFEEPISLADPEYLGSYVYLAPHKERRELTLVWELPFRERTALDTHSDALISFVLGHEGPGSLLESLKADGLAEELGSGLRQHVRPESKQSQLILSIELTPKGLQERAAVIGRVYQMVHLIAQEGISRQLYDEMNQMALLNYEFQSRENPFEQVEQYAAEMISEPLETYPKRTLLASQYDPEEIKAYASQLTPQQSLIFVNAPTKETGVYLNRTNPWTGVAYAVEKVPTDQMIAWRRVEPSSALHLPEANPLIPKALALLNTEKPDLSFPHPEKIIANEWGEFYYALDRQFQVPELFARFELLSEVVRENDPRSAVLLDLFVRSVTEKLTGVSYLAKVAGLSYTLNPNAYGLVLTVNGYSEQAPEFVREIVAQFREGLPSQEKFEIYRDSLAREYRNFEREAPIRQGLDLLRGVTYESHISPEGRAKAIASIDYEQFKAFFSELTDAAYLRGMSYGNLTREEAEGIWEIVHEASQSVPYPAGKELRPKVVVLPESHGPFILEKQINNQGNAAILAIQQGPFSFEKRAVQQILSMALSTPFFNELRTKQQTGYVVQSWDGTAEQELFQYFAVESNSHDSRDLLARFELMIEQFNHHLTDSALPQERFEVIRSSLVERLQNPVNNLAEMGALLSLLAFEKEGDFDYFKKRITATQELSYEQFVALAREALSGGNKRRVALLVSGNLPESAIRYQNVPSQARFERIATYESLNE